MRGGNSCEHGPWGIRGSSLWGHEPCDGVWRHGRGDAMRALPLGPSVDYGATKRVRVVATWRGDAMRALPFGPSVEFPMGPRSV